MTISPTETLANSARDRVRRSRGIRADCHDWDLEPPINWISYAVIWLSAMSTKLSTEPDFQMLRALDRRACLEPKIVVLTVNQPVDKPADCDVTRRRVEINHEAIGRRVHPEIAIPDTLSFTRPLPVLPMELRYGPVVARQSSNCRCCRSPRRCRCPKSCSTTKAPKSKPLIAAGAVTVKVRAVVVEVDGVADLDRLVTVSPSLSVTAICAEIVEPSVIVSFDCFGSSLWIDRYCATLTSPSASIATANAATSAVLPNFAYPPPSPSMRPTMIPFSLNR